jgi:hypothetical protein
VFERRRKCFFGPCPAKATDFDSHWHQKLELHEAGFLEVGERHSIVKTFFVMKGVQNIGIANDIFALFLLSSNSHEMKIPTVSTKSST